MSTSSIPAFAVPGANVISDPMLRLNDMIDALDTSLANEPAGSAVNVQSVELSNYHCEKMCLSVEQFSDPVFPPHDVQSSHLRSRSAPLCRFTFDNLEGVVSATLSTECNTSDSAMEDAALVRSSQKVVQKVCR